MTKHEIDYLAYKLFNTVVLGIVFYLLYQGVVGDKWVKVAAAAVMLWYRKQQND